MNEKLKKSLKYILSLSVAAALLYLAFRRMDWAQFWAALKDCRWGFVLLSMAAGGTAFFIRSQRWRMLLLPINPQLRRRTTYNAVCISYIANLVIGYIGEFVRCGIITAHSPKEKEGDGEAHRLASYDKVLGTIVVERAWDIVSMGIFLLVFLLATWQRFGSFFVEKIFGVTAGRLNAGVLLGLVVLLFLGGAFVWAVLHFSGRWKPLEKVAAFLRGIGKGVVSGLKMKKAWMFFVLTVLLWGCYWMMSASIVWAVQGISADALGPGFASVMEKLAGLDLVDALFLTLAGALSSLVPVPGGFGAFHIVVSTAISYVYGIPVEIGLIFATLSHESQILTQILSGGIAYADEARQIDLRF